REDTWISEGLVKSYCDLHRMGFAHSVEAWHGGKLAGGLYGVALRGAFFGESMFTRVRDASKTALVALMNRLKSRGFLLLDAQYLTLHLARFGAREISRAEYLVLLERALASQRSFTDEVRHA
ncbi:MAG: leucyl/phenylalanyl-tRNA--protein transferase, partial [Bacteroidota bacterium]